MPDTTVATEAIKDAVRLACRAPSLYNSQPWRWVCEGAELELFLDPSRVMLVDRLHREALVGCGAALDHLRVVMAATGWQAHVDRFPNPNEPNHLATIAFTPADHVTDDDRRRADAILLRRTDRLPFKPPMKWQSFEPLLHSIVIGDAVHLDVLSDDVRPQLVEAYQIAESLRLYDSLYHAELDWWTAPFEASEGISYDSLLTAAESDRVDVRRVFPLAHHRERRTNVPEDYAKILILSTESDTAADALACGETLSAVLLECTMAGLATCTLTYLTELRVTRDMVAALLDHDCLPQVLVRVGVAPAMEEVPPPTPRRPLDEVLRMRPIVEVMTINFSLLALDQIVNHAAKMHAMFAGQVSVPLVIRTPGGGGQQLAATHSQNLEVWYAHVPGMKVVTPATPADAKALLTAAVRDDDPVLFLENLALYNTKGDVPDGEQIGRIGCASVAKPGTDLTVVAYSRSTVIALDVARQFEDDGVSIEVVDLRSLRPLDRETICASVRKTSRAVILEDDWLSYGVGAEIAATIAEGAFDYLDAPIRRVAAAEVPLPYAKPLELAALPDAADLTKVIHEVLDASRFAY